MNVLIAHLYVVQMTFRPAPRQRKVARYHWAVIAQSPEDAIAQIQAREKGPNGEPRHVTDCNWNAVQTNGVAAFSPTMVRA